MKESSAWPAYQCSFHLGADVPPVGVGDQLGESEVGDLGGEVLVHEDVAGLDVPVDDGRVGELVEVGQPARRSQRHPEPLLPVEVQAALAGEAVAQRAAGHELVDEHLLPLLEAEADEADEVLVVHAGEQLDLGLELVAALHRPLLRPLDGDELPRRQHAPVHLAVAPVPELVRLGEVVGAPLELLVGEPPRPLEPRRAAPLLAPSPRRCRRQDDTAHSQCVPDGRGQEHA